MTVERRSERDRYQRRKKVQLGRVCSFCQCADTEAPWSYNETQCGACHKQLTRKGKCSCGRPVRFGRVLGEDYCSICDEEKLRKAGYKKILLLSPDGTDDRERIIWRTAAALLERKNMIYVGAEGRRFDPIIITASKDQWRLCR